MNWETTNHYFSGQGVVLLAKRGPDGKPLGYKPAGNVSDLKISVAVSTLEHKESTSGQRATDMRLTTETKCSLSMTMENFIASNLADSLRGDVTTLAGGSVTAELVTGHVGAITALEHLRVTDLVLKTTDATPVTLTPFTTEAANWDYRLNPDAGSFMLNPNAATRVNLAITPPATSIALTAAYTFAEQVLVDALTGGADELAMRFEGLNTAEEQAPVIVEVFKFLTDPLKELALISDSVQQFNLEGSVLADSSRTTGSKFFRVKKLN